MALLVELAKLRASIIERLLATDGTVMSRDLVRGYVDRHAAQERRVEVVGAGTTISATVGDLLGQLRRGV
jgi:hypothetical protein